MEINRATTLAKVLARDRALDARDSKDTAIEKGRLADAHPGSANFQQTVEVMAQDLADLMEAKVSSVRDAHAQTNIPVTGQTVENALEALHASLETVISASVGSWGGSLALVQKRTGETVAGGAEVLAEAERELKRRADKLCEKAEAKLDVLLQSSLAASERSEVVESRNNGEVSPTYDVFISHATEDKPYVEPLVEALEAAGIKVWFDKTALEWGDDLRPSIDRGLANCRYGIVVLSKAFLGKKKWTEYELNSLFALEQPGKKIILPSGTASHATICFNTVLDLRIDLRRFHRKIATKTSSRACSIWWVARSHRQLLRRRHHSLLCQSQRNHTLTGAMPRQLRNWNCQQLDR